MFHYFIIVFFFFRCKPGYSDTDCSEGPKLCEVANPCTNGGTCKVNDDGEVECMCPDGEYCTMCTFVK